MQISLLGSVVDCLLEEPSATAAREVIDGVPERGESPGVRNRGRWATAGLSGPRWTCPRAPHLGHLRQEEDPIPDKARGFGRCPPRRTPASLCRAGTRSWAALCCWGRLSLHPVPDQSKTQSSLERWASMWFLDPRVQTSTSAGSGPQSTRRGACPRDLACGCRVENMTQPVQ